LQYEIVNLLAFVHADSGETTRWDALSDSGPYQNPKKIQQDYGLSRSLGFGSDSQRRTTRHRAGCSEVSSTQPPSKTFNQTRNMLK